MNHSKFYVKDEDRNGPGHSKLDPYYDDIQAWLEEKKTYDEIIAMLPIPCSTGNLCKWIQRRNKPGTRVKPSLPKRKIGAPLKSTTVLSKPAVSFPVLPSVDDKGFIYQAGAPLTKRQKEQP